MNSRNGADDDGDASTQSSVCIKGQELGSTSHTTVCGVPPFL
jgi:hypothetical protein